MNKQAIEAGAKAEFERWIRSSQQSRRWDDPNEHSTRENCRESATVVLTAALEHIIPAKCGSDIVNVFQLAYNQESAANGVNAREAGINAILSHLRGEGKRAEASTPPTVKECLTVEPNPDDVERVARAMYEQSYDRPPTIKWHELGMTKKAWLDMATAAIRAMNGQLWGVWAGGSGWLTVPQKPNKDFVTHDQDNAALIVLLAKQLNPGYGYEVRPYTAPREKPATQLIAENIVIKHNCQHVPGLAESIAESLESEKRGTAKCG